MTAPEVASLYRAALLWAIGEGGVEPVVRAACEALAGGWDGAALRELAGISVNAERLGEDVEDIVVAALTEVGSPLPARGAPELQEQAVRLMAREALAGRWGARELAAWAHRVIGHEGLSMAQPLVELDDRYDVSSAAGEDRAALDEEVIAYCRSVALV